MNQNILFPKDILIIDFEAIWFEAEKKEPIPFQIGAVLLDKSSFEEKKHFDSFIHVDLTKTLQAIWAAKGYEMEKVANAPNSAEVASKFLEHFGKDYFLSSWAANFDMRLFAGLMSSVDVRFSEFDYHIYDLWPVAYMYLLERGYTGSWRSEAMFQELELPARGAHNALEDCRHEAQILRTIIGKSR